MLAVQHEIAREYITAAVVKLSCELILLCRYRSFTTGSACRKAAHAAGPIQTTEMQMPDGRAVAAGMLSVWRIAPCCWKRLVSHPPRLRRPTAAALAATVATATQPI